MRAGRQVSAEMAASLDEQADARQSLAHARLTLLVDEDQITQLREAVAKPPWRSRSASFITWLGCCCRAILANRLSPALTFSGASLNFFPMGAGQTLRAIFIRRQTKVLPSTASVTCLRRAAGAAISLTWSIEGGPDRRRASYGHRCSGSCVTSPMRSRRKSTSRSVFSADLDVRPAARGGSHDHRGLWRSETTEDLRFLVQLWRDNPG